MWRGYGPATGKLRLLVRAAAARAPKGLRRVASGAGGERACGSHAPSGRGGSAMIRKLKGGEYRLYSRKKDPKTGKRRNLGTFRTRAAAAKHEKAVQFFKRR
jgi:hypothetical protein